VTETLQPTSAIEVAAALKRAADARQSIVIRGAGTKSEWGRAAGRIDAVLEMRGLDRILAHEHGDMTATIEAGATLADVNRALATHGQMLPLDPPFADRATIGGLLATNDSGPLRHRYGTPRDLVIGIQLATTDGVLSKAGGQVVKNVAGYDLSKLVTGSFGSLAAIVSATFKLAPIPAASKTLRVGVSNTTAVAAIVKTMMSSQLEPAAFEISTNVEQRTSNVAEALLRFASLPIVVDAQIAEAATLLKTHSASIDVLDGDAERGLWNAHATEIWDQPGAIVRASWLPANVAAVLAALKGCATHDVPQGTHDVAEGTRDVAQGTHDVAQGAHDVAQGFSPAFIGRTAIGATPVAQGFSPAFVGRAAIGAGLVRIDGDTDAQVAAITELRASPLLGNIVIVRGSPELKARVDVWGSFGDRQPLLESLKRTLDPHNVLNAGRGPL
jgi:FAD/FMN-containing dehydrogenase